MTEVVDRVTVANFVAKHIKNSAKGEVDEEQFAGAISEIEMETQIEGASFIRVHLIDPYWQLATSGFLEVSDEGLLDKIECEFPENSGWWWRLAAVELGNTLDANLVLVFEDRIVAWLREMRGEKVCPPGLTTRAQFVRTLLVEPGLKDPKKKIKPVIPSLKEVQPVESKKVTNQEILSRSVSNAMSAQANKSPDTGKLTPDQYTFAGDLAGQTGLDAKVIAAWCLAEESDSAAKGRENEHNNNWLNIGYFDSGPGQIAFNSAFKDPKTGAEQTARFLKGEWGGASSGIRAILTSAKSGAEAQMTAIANSGWASSGYEKGEALRKLYGEIGTRETPASGSGETGESDVKQLQRGSTQNPDENSFECIQRLAKQVRWFAFSNGSYFYYMDGFDFERQKPSALIDLPGRTVKNEHTGKTEANVVLSGLLANFDNTTFEYFSSHKRHGRAIRKSKIAKPQTPSEIHLPVLCAPTEYRAGDVFVIKNSGPLNGRWVVTDTVRKYIEDPFTTFTLEPPEAPYPETRASKTKNGSGAAEGLGENPLGELKSVVENAKQALSEKSKYKYVYGAGHSSNATLFGNAPREMDCSAFAELCYKAAGQPDPAGGTYTAGTAEQISHMIKTDQPQPGNLCFYGADEAHTIHVAIYVGNGKCISMGSLGDPSELGVEQMGENFLGYWRPVI